MKNKFQHFALGNLTDFWYRYKLLIMVLLIVFVPLFANAQINLSISKTNNAPNPIPSGQPFTYTITYSWSGGAPGTLYIVDNVPATLDVISALPSSPVSSISGNNVIFTLTGLTLPSGSGIVQINARFKPGVTCGGVEACNIAGISTSHDGEYVYSNKSCVTSAQPVNRWSIEKEWIAGCAVDDEIIYRIKITAPAGNNIGGINLTNVNLQDLVPANAILTGVTGSWYSFSGSNPYTLNGPTTLYVNSYPVWYTAYVKVKYLSPYFTSGQTVLNTATVTFDTPCDSNPVTWSDTATTVLCTGVSQGNLYKWLTLGLSFPNNPSYYPVWTPGCCGTYRLYYKNTGTLGQPGFVMEDDVPGEVDVNQIKTNVPSANAPVTVDVYCWSGGTCSTTPCTTAVYSTAGYHTMTGLPANVCKVKWTYSGSTSVNQTLYNYLDVCVRTTNFMNGTTVTTGQNITNTLNVSATNLSTLTTTHTKVVDSTQPKIVATKLFIGGCNPPCSINPSGPFQPGDTVRFRMAVANIGNQDATSCTITDNLPSYISYVGNETYFYGGFNWMVNQYNPPCCSTSTTVPSDIGGTINTPSPGDTSLTWTFPVLPSRCDGTVDYFIIEFDVLISEMPPAPPGQYQNKFTINSSNHPNVVSNTAYLTVNQTAQLQAIKEVRKINTGSAPGPWSMSTSVPAGGSGEYRIKVKNTGNTQLSDLCLLDIMPWVGDISVLPAYISRNSTFNLPYNPSAGSINILNAGFNDTYNNVGLLSSRNPTRSTECGGFCGISDPSGAIPGNFVSTVAQTYSFKISASGGTNLFPGDSLLIIIPFDLPVQVQPQEIACNSFGVKAVPLGISNVCLSAESNNACVVAAEPEPCIKIGDNRIECLSTDENGNSVYQVFLNLTNLGTSAGQLFISSSNGTIVSFSPNILPSNVPTNVQMIYTSPDSINNVCFTISLISQEEQKLCDTTICFDYKQCQDPCPCPFDIKIDETQASQASGNQVFFNNIISISNPVLQIRASVVSATVTQNCWWGGSTTYTTNATFVNASTNPILTQGIGTSELTYTNYQCPQVTNQQFSFYLDIPSAPHFWCYQNVKVCVRYTLTDCKCSTCDTLICYEFRRKWMPIIWHDEVNIKPRKTHKSIDKNKNDIPQVAETHFAVMDMDNENVGTLKINNPAEDEYTASLTIHSVSLKAAAGVKVTAMTPDKRSWNSGVPSEYGMKCTGILSPGNSIKFAVKFENISQFKQWMNDVTISYTMKNVPDTLVGKIQVKSRTPGASGGDMLTSDYNYSGTASRAKTFALRFDAYNLSADSIAKVILKVTDGAIIAVGPPLSTDNSALNGYYTTGGQWRLLPSAPDGNVAVMAPIPPATSIQPVFLTAVNDDEESITIEYETYTSDNDLVTKGSLTIETPITGIDDGGIIKADIFLSEAIPNPAQHKTLIKFNLLQDEPDVSLIITDLRGNIVSKLLQNESYGSGSHEIIFDTSKLTNGVYYYTLTTAGATQTRRLVIIR